MGFPQDKAKLLLDDPVEENDLDNSSYPREGYNFGLVLVVLLVCFGTFYAAATYQYIKQPERVLVEAGHGRYRKWKVFQHEKFSLDEQWNEVHVDKKVPYEISGINFKFVNSFDPPPRQEKAKTARYIIHNSLWGSVSTISESLEGAPFSMVTSFSDGPLDNSTGIPYFYLSSFDPVVHNIKSNELASFSVSEAQSDYCKAHNWDPEEPLCSRVTLNGKLLHVGPDELKFAQNALFSRHPVMKTWPKDHDWQTLKLNITRVWLQDNYGAANIITVEDYLKVNL